MEGMDRYLTINEVSGILSIKPATIYKWVERGLLPANKMGRLVRIRLADLQEWIEKTILQTVQRAGKERRHTDV